MEESARGRSARPDHPEIGGRLREARRERRLSVRELARRLGVSSSLISQIERGRANPSVSTLYAIASELDVSLDELLFNDRRSAEVAPAGGAVTVERPAEPLGERPGEIAIGPGVLPAAGSPYQPAATRKRIRLASGVIWERLTTTSEPGVEFLYVIYEVGGASAPPDAYQRHPGHEWGYVISGVLQVTLGFEDYVLQAGDAISFHSSIPHRLANIGDTPVHAVWFVLGRSQFDQHLVHENDALTRG
ncbi:MAG TPA: XRE family transcriptional regulator [Candidatus Binatia bacterium]|nr:XRE family transcriptional regulator [Candidatus Binatia bacterium]